MMSHVDESQITAYLDQQLEYADPENRRELGRHIADCGPCMRLLKVVREHRERANGLLEGSVPPAAAPPPFESVAERAGTLEGLERSVPPPDPTDFIDDPGFDLHIPLADASPPEHDHVVAGSESDSTADDDDFDLSIRTVDEVTASPPADPAASQPRSPSVADPDAPIEAVDDFDLSIPTVDDAVAEVSAPGVEAPMPPGESGAEPPPGAESAPPAEATLPTPVDEPDGEVRPSLMMDMGLITSDAFGRGDQSAADEDDTGADLDVPMVDEAATQHLSTREDEQRGFERGVPDLELTTGTEGLEVIEDPAEPVDGGLQLESVTDWESTSADPSPPPPPLELESASLATNDDIDTAGLPPLELEPTSLADAAPPPVSEPLSAEPAASGPPPAPTPLELESAELINAPGPPPPPPPTPAAPPPPPVDPAFDLGSGPKPPPEESLAGDVPDLAGLSLQSASDMAADDSAPPPPGAGDLGFGDLAPETDPLDAPPAPPEPATVAATLGPTARSPERPSIGTFDRALTGSPRPAAAKTSSGGKGWMALAATIVVAGGAGAAWWFGVIPGRQVGTEPTVAAADAPNQPIAAGPAVEGTDPARTEGEPSDPDAGVTAPQLDSLAAAEGELVATVSGAPTVVALADSPPVPTPAAPSASEALPAAMDSAAALAENQDALEVRSRVVARDTTPVAQIARERAAEPAPPTPPVPTPARQAPGRGGVASGLSAAAAGAMLGGPMVIVDGLAIESIRQFSANGRIAIRLVQIDDDGNRVTVEIIPSTATPGEPEPTAIITGPGGPGSTGFARWGSYEINASSAVNQDVLRGYLGRLIQAPGAD